MPYDDFEVADRRARRAKGRSHTLADGRLPAPDPSPFARRPGRHARWDRPAKPSPAGRFALFVAALAAAVAAYKAARARR